MTYTVRSKDRKQAVYVSNRSGNYYIKDCDKGHKGCELYETRDRDDAISTWMMCGGAYGEMEIVGE